MVDWEEIMKGGEAGQATVQADRSRHLEREEIRDAPPSHGKVQHAPIWDVDCSLECCLPPRCGCRPLPPQTLPICEQTSV